MQTSPKFFGFQKPINMLEKAKRELKRLQEETNTDNIYNFYTTAYHIQDYAQQYEAIPKNELKNFLQETEILDCMDLCNKAKHLELTRNRKDPQTIVYDNHLSGNTPLGSLVLDGGESWTLKTVDGREVDVVELAIVVINKWQVFLSKFIEQP